jgi:outer membrane lipopolysaccharide assembly protein LptE/RlpB
MIIICQPSHEIVDKAVEFSLILNKTDFYFIFIPEENYEIINFLTGPGLRNRFTVNSFNLDLIPIDNDLVSMEREGSFRQIYLDNDITPIADFVDSFIKLELCFGKIKHKYIKGEKAKLFCDLLTKKQIETNIKTTDEILGMIVLDRKIDFLTPMTTNYTYEGLFDEHFGIKFGNIYAEKSLIKVNFSPSEANQKGLYSLTSESNLFHSKIRCMNYLDANKFISELEGYYIERAKKKENTKDLKVLEEDIQSFNDFLTLYKNPIIINKRIISLFINENLKEENMAYRIKESIFLSGAFPNNLKLFYDDYIADKKDLYKLLNLFIIETLTQGGVKDYNTLKRDILNVYGYQYIFLFRDLEAIGLLKEKEVLKNFLMEKSYQQIIKKLNLISAETDYIKSKVKDCSYIYQGYCPIILRLIELAVGGKWNKFKDIISKLPGDTFYPEDETEISKPKSEEQKVQTIFVVFVGGVSYNEIEGIRFINRYLKLLHDKNKDKSIGRIQLIIVTNEILNRKKIFNSLGMKFEQSYSFKKLKNDIDKANKKEDKKEEKKENKK